MSTEFKNCIEINVIAAREYREILSWINELDADIREKVEEKLRNYYGPSQQAKEKALKLLKMDDGEARGFENARMPINGQYHNELIGNIPASYLLWITESNQQFLKDLRRYCASDHFQRMQPDCE